MKNKDIAKKMSGKVEHLMIFDSLRRALAGALKAKGKVSNFMEESKKSGAVLDPDDVECGRA